MPFDHFGIIAGLYDRSAPFLPSELLLSLLSLSAGQRLLDAGGGTGRVSMALRSMVREVCVADVSFGMLRYSVRKGLSALCAPAEQLPFAAETFDRVIMLDALHHVFDQHQTAMDLWRVLSPGGRLVIIEPDIHQFSVKLIALAEKLLLMRSHFLDGAQITSLFPDPGARLSVVPSESNLFILVEKSSKNRLYF